MLQPHACILINDKRGIPVCIDRCPRGWKITPRQRDTIYQNFLTQFPSRIWKTPHAMHWMKLEAERWPITAIRIRDFISEALAAEKGELDESWGWWIGCSSNSAG